MVVSLVQSTLDWENPKANRERFSKIITKADAADLFVLPEMFTTGFTMNPQPVAETMVGETLAWMKNIAALKDAAICGSVVIEENENFYNRFLLVTPNGEVYHYDKRHLFTLAGEHQQYTGGRDKVIVSFRGINICLQVCYDLRFPVFARNTEDYDLLIYTANWPKVRIAAWDALLKARAIENMCYVAAVNRIGTDANGHEYVGHSQAIDFLGAPVVEPFEREEIVSFFLNREEMLTTRKRLGFLNDRDSFTVH